LSYLRYARSFLIIEAKLSQFWLQSMFLDVIPAQAGIPKSAIFQSSCQPIAKVNSRQPGGKREHSIVEAIST